MKKAEIISFELRIEIYKSTNNMNDPIYLDRWRMVLTGTFIKNTKCWFMIEQSGPIRLFI